MGELLTELRELSERYPANRWYRESADRIEALERPLVCEELSILHGQQVVVTFRNSDDAFDLFNELRARSGEHLSPTPIPSPSSSGDES